MAKIKIMDELLANKIAAGEVVERCASVVKEVVENSIDADSTEIKIELKDAGTTEIKVIDNGNGMDREDAVNCFNRHATSKLIDEDDLYRINTLGFRGEALASIASVSKVNLKTSLGDYGTEVQINGGKVEFVNNCEARKGTAITVSDLFYNTPARLKHMKSLYTELASITDYINKLSLSHPGIKFVFSNNGTKILNTDGSNNLLKTISAIYGLDIVKKMVMIKGENDDYEVEGYITLPEVHRSSRNNMITIVNGRVVKNAELNKRINDSYHSYKPDNRYPIVVLNINTDPSLIDVNIHPTKMDIKFSKISDLLDLIENMIKNVLTKKNLIPEVEVNEIIENKPKYEEITLDLNRIEEPSEVYEYVASSKMEEVKTPNDQQALKIDLDDEKRIPDIKEEPVDRLPELYPIGLVHGTYIICQNEQGMYMIDQHAAKERINYEYYKEKLGHPNNDSISLLIPITIELSNREFIILKQNFDLLKNMQFDIQEFGQSSIIVKAHPTWLPMGYEEDAIRKIIDVIVEYEREFNIEKFNEKIATMMSCKLAIKANMNITTEEMESLINDLRKCHNPFNCPHGRPTLIYYSNYDLEKLFKRSGFENKS
ncbi:MAG: DNA mismatch repair endonuclease MutL [Bacilli bacterium]